MTCADSCPFKGVRLANIHGLQDMNPTTHQRRWKVQQWRKSTGKSGTYSSIWSPTLAVNECKWGSLYRYLWDLECDYNALPLQIHPTVLIEIRSARCRTDALEIHHVHVQDTCGDLPNGTKMSLHVFALNSKSWIVAWCYQRIVAWCYQRIVEIVCLSSKATFFSTHHMLIVLGELTSDLHL